MMLSRMTFRGALETELVRGRVPTCRTLQENEEDETQAKGARTQQKERESQEANEGAQGSEPAQYIDNPKRYTESYAGVHQLQRTLMGLFNQPQDEREGAQIWGAQTGTPKQAEVEASQDSPRVQRGGERAPGLERERTDQEARRREGRAAGGRGRAGHREGHATVG